ncbi:MAG: DUF1554 domain-containing protein, partial [Burkholderiales bacterium]|nr:DUF1554 domain-containing protein [Burkholderiales bacterium]
TITLSNSTGVNSLPVTVVADNSKITLSASTCNLSTASNTCNVTVTAGNESGNTTLVASATGYTSANKAITVNPQPVPVPTKWVFVSQSSPNGAMVVANSVWQPTGANGIAKADAICQHDAESVGWIPNNVARTLTWKAMIVDGVNRAAKPTPINWIFESNTQYIDIKGGGELGTTTPDSIFAFPLTQGIGNPQGYDWSAYTGFVVTWTGLTSDWATKPPVDLCNRWTGTAGDGGQGNAVMSGQPQVSSAFIDLENWPCDDQDNPGDYATRIVCVSQ